MSLSSDTADSSWLKSRLPSKDDKAGLLALPGLLAYTGFMLFPLFYLVFLSFTNAQGPEDLIRSEWTFVALDNYLTLIQDSQFWQSMGITWLFVFSSVSMKIGFSIFVALVLTHDRVKGKRYMRAIVIIPLGLPGIFKVTVWRSVFSNARFGLANTLYINIMEIFGRSPDPILWLANRWMAFASYVLAELWLAYPFMVIIIVSALQDVSGELHDAAKVDGAGYLHRFVHVTLPAIKRPVWFASILTAAASFQQFLVPFVFNEGGPARKNELILVYGYREAFQRVPSNMGLGSAIMVSALIFIAMFMWINVKKGRLADGVQNA
ncbi:carbohydrate ABC transporter membrane protein 1, CUT1 family [Natronoarchaeum philippinense]|uniref:Carbohydrate ABC transporter membrane protein 1, CUT1 family n=1 Tax=Natronoarchaeum philippinense TaxID=558529 RepID=A0A285P3P7_NATPI|nr:sugar ABC transporter permease [Natronoarchaeum philippinense]SNZ15877.1 carbohydrate ABC transporter membrane protein 1, CUT1 family [Natronoarchaeum philippinense]